MADKTPNDDSFSDPQSLDNIRGRIVSLLATLCWKAGDLILLCRKIPGYEDTAATAFPATLSGRLDLALAIFSHDGVLDQYRPRLTMLIEQISREASWLESVAYAAAHRTHGVILFVSYTGDGGTVSLADDVSIVMKTVETDLLEERVTRVVALDSAFTLALSELDSANDPMLRQATTFMAAYRGMVSELMPARLFEKASGA